MFKSGMKLQSQSTDERDSGIDAKRQSGRFHCKTYQTTEFGDKRLPKSKSPLASARSLLDSAMANIHTGLYVHEAQESKT